MKRAKRNATEEERHRDTTPDRDETGTVDWNKFRETKLRNYVLDQKGLSNLKLEAELESDSEMEEDALIPTEQEVAKELEATLNAWEEYTASVRITQAQKVKCQQFIQDLINSSLSIKEQQDGIGTSYTSVIINSGDLTLDWDELFEPEPTKIQALTACLVYASIFIPAMVVKSYRTFSATNILKLVNAQVIRVEWTASIHGRRRVTRLTVPKGEIQFFASKACHLKRNSQDWWMQLVKPMNVKFENDMGQEMTYKPRIGKFYADGKPVTTSWTPEKVASLTIEIQILFYFYAKAALSLKPTLWKCLHERLKALNLSVPSNTMSGSKTMSTLAEFWYFKSR